MNYELAIIGAGPAGYSATIYAVRAGIKTVLLEKGFGGGLAAISPNIENYPGFESISGIDLTEKMKAHVSKYSNDIHYNVEVKKIKKDKDIFIIEANTTSQLAELIAKKTGIMIPKQNRLLKYDVRPFTKSEVFRWIYRI